MMYTSSLMKAKLVRRYKRFLADVELEGGDQTTIYCPNTGAMTYCADPGSEVWFSSSSNLKRKYRFTWEQVRDRWGNRVGIHSSLANTIVGEALSTGKLQELDAMAHGASWLKNIDSIRAESPVVDKSVRFDFSITPQGGSPILVEVKSVTMAEDDGLGRFPDAITARGQKQVKAMIELQSQGIRSMLVYCVQNDGVQQFQLAKDVDAKYAEHVHQFLEGGGRILVIGCQIDSQQVSVNRYIPWITS